MKMLRRLYEWIREILFPCFCVSCDAEGSWWCEACQARYADNYFPACPVCARATNNGEPCVGCRAHCELACVNAVYRYSEFTAIGKLIRAFKYRYSSDIQRLWREILAHTKFEDSSVTLVPVPLHGRRERERGYNQAQIICDVLAERYQLPVESGSLIRIRHTAQQAKLGRAGRLANMKSAFEWRGGSVPLHIILVDDVYTTGATMQECARVLRAAGAERVEGFVIARG